MSTNIHPTAVIEPGAEIDEEVLIGAYAHIGSKVRIRKWTNVMHHATVDGMTSLGERNEIHPYAYIGGKTHDVKYEGGSPELIIGSDNVFREYTTVHCASSENTKTIVGNHNLLLAYSHIAHECIVGDHLIMSSQAALAGHVQVGNRVNIGWGTGVHQFCRIGDYAMLGAKSKITKDVPPYMIIDGSPAVVRAINKVGLTRNKFSPEDMSLIYQIFKIFYQKGLNRRQASEELKKYKTAEESKIVKTFLEFVQSGDRGLS